MQTKLAPRPPPTPSPPTAPYPFQSLESANAVLLLCPDSAAFRRGGDGFATPQRMAKYQQPALLAPRKAEESFLSPEAHQRCITPRGLNFTPPSANMIAANLFQRDLLKTPQNQYDLRFYIARNMPMFQLSPLDALDDMGDFPAFMFESKQNAQAVLQQQQCKAYTVFSELFSFHEQQPNFRLKNQELQFSTRILITLRNLYGWCRKPDDKNIHQVARFTASFMADQYLHVQQTMGDEMCMLAFEALTFANVYFFPFLQMSAE